MSVAATNEFRYDPFEDHADPYPVYAALREHHPVHHAAIRDVWILSRFDDVQAAARDWGTFSSAAGVDLDDTGELWAPGGFVDFDPPDHRRMRAVLHHQFSPRHIRERLEPGVRARARSLIDDLVASGGGDLARDLARPLPAWVVCDWLGFPEADHPALDRWFGDMLVRVPGSTTIPEQAWSGWRAMRAYLEDVVEDRLQHPRDDLLSAMVAGERDGVLSRDEVLGMCIFIFFAGINTTIGLIAYGLLLLERHPEQRELLRADLSLVPRAVEEILRVEPPIQWLARLTTRDVEMHGQVIPADSRVMLLYAAANRDPRRFDDPDRFDIMREPRRHLAFGESIHHCIGAPLARLEARVVLEELLPRIPSWRLTGPVERVFTPGERLVSSIPVAIS
jgi:hypothetical protein